MEQLMITRQQIEEFLQKLQSLGKSRNIIAEYRRNLNRLYETAEKHEYKLNREVLKEWRADQEKQGLASGTGGAVLSKRRTPEPCGNALCKSDRPGAFEEESTGPQHLLEMPVHALRKREGDSRQSAEKRRSAKLWLWTCQAPAGCSRSPQTGRKPGPGRCREAFGKK